MKKVNKTNLQNMFKIQTFFIEYIEMIKFVNKFEKVIDNKKKKKKEKKRKKNVDQ